MKKKSKKSDNLLLVEFLTRYLLLFLAGLGNLYIFYLILDPITLIGVGSILSLFSSEFLYLTKGFMFNGVIFILVTACVGGSAFYLLFILIMSTRDINVKRRIMIILFSFLILYLFNIFRILLMVFIYGTFYFDFVHWVFWYFLSTLFVVLIWIYDVKKFKIKTIPVYSDIKWLYNSIKSSNKNKIKKTQSKKKKVKSKKAKKPNKK